MSILSRFNTARFSPDQGVPEATSRLSSAWILGAIAIVGMATLTPQQGPSAGAHFFDPIFPESTGQWRDVAQNVLLYLPLGLLLGGRRRSWQRAVLTAAAISLATELFQLIVPGRDPSVRDVFTNSLGAFAGWAVAGSGVGGSIRRFLRAIERGVAMARHPSRKLSADLSLGWALVVSTVVVITCWLESVALPPPFFFGVANSAIDRPRGPLRVGGDGSGVRGFTGLIDEVRIYARARSPREVESDMERPVAHETWHPDLVAALGFDVNRGNSALDASGHARRAETMQTTWVPDGRYGGALKFNGRTSQVVIPDASFDLSRGLTLEAWVYPTDRLIDDAPIIADGDDRYFLRATSYQSRVPRAGVKFGGAPRMIGPRRSLPLRRWSHVATTYDGRQLRLYVNAQLEGVFDHWSSHQPERATLNGADLPFGLMRNPEQVPSVLLGEFSLKVTVRCGALEPSPAPIFLIAGLQSINALELVAAGSELRVRYPQQARRLGLAPADYRIPGVLENCGPGQSQSMSFKGPLQASRLYDAQGGELRGVRPGIGSAWSFLLDSQWLPWWLVAAVSCFYLTALVFPFGFWVRPTIVSAVAVMAMVMSFTGAPRVWGLAPLAWPDAVSIAAGSLLGVAASWKFRRAVAPVGQGPTSLA